MNLFRAVLPPELASLRSLGHVWNPPGIERKYFAIDAAGARRYATAAEAAFGDGPFTIVATAIDDTLVAEDSRVVVDRSIVTVTIPTNLLYALTAPSIQEDE